MTNALCNVIIDGRQVAVTAESTILDAAIQAGAKVPTLCWMKDLNLIGSCRMCVVEVEGRQELVAAINDFLAALPETKRRIFVCRYWYFESVSDIAARFAISENRVSVTLHRLRTQLRRCLSERGFML